MDTKEYGVCGITVRKKQYKIQPVKDIENLKYLSTNEQGQECLEDYKLRIDGDENNKVLLSQGGVLENQNVEDEDDDAERSRYTPQTDLDNIPLDMCVMDSFGTVRTECELSDRVIK